MSVQGLDTSSVGMHSNRSAPALPTQFPFPAVIEEWCVEPAAEVLRSCLGTLGRGEVGVALV